MEILVASLAGFCFGVNNAVRVTYEQLQKDSGHIYTLGPIIHNEQVINWLKVRGVSIIDDVSGASNGGAVVIRAHGVVPEVFADIEGRGLQVIDATCPYVKKIHNLVKDKYDNGYQIIIVGDKNHPEVKGINGWCGNTAVIVNSVEEAQELEDFPSKVCVVAQTTIIREKWTAITKILENKYENFEKYDTICNATSSRQKEAAEIAKKVDLMLVVGGKNSSNTQKLFEICKMNCSNTYMIETASDLQSIKFNSADKIGITAGASTPEEIIKEVKEKMEELNKQEKEMSFKEAFESSLVTLRTGEIVKGRIIGFNNTEVFVDLGYKSDGIVPMEEFTDDPDFKPETDIKAGDEIEVFVIRVNDGEGNVVLSKRKVDSIKSFDKIEEAYESKAPVKAKVVEVVNGGVIANSGGVRIFVPASQISDRYVKDLNEFLKQTLNLRIIEFNKQKKKFVGSQRVILEEEKEKRMEEIWGSIEVGKRYKGTVKSFTDFGAFVDIGGVDGLIHVSELSWKKIKHPSEVLKIGDIVEVSILEFDREKNRISLGFKKAEDNPWYKVEERYKVGDVVKAKVARLVPFGAFLQLEEGLDGLVHISQISNVRLNKPGDVLSAGQEVEAKIIEVNSEAKKIGLSIKEVCPIDPVNAVKEEKPAKNAKQEEPAGEALPTEHKEDMGITIGDMLSEDKE